MRAMIIVMGLAGIGFLGPASESFAQPAGPTSTTTGTMATPTGAPGAPAPAVDPATVPTEQMPTSIRMRRLEQRTQALKERAWQLKARVQMLQEQLVGAGTGSQAVIRHSNEMGSAFRLIKLGYQLDGVQVFTRTDAAADTLYKTKSFDVFVGPISPGSHVIAVTAEYRGNGAGVLSYLTKYTFAAHSTQQVTIGEGRISDVTCRGIEKGGPTTPMEKRPAIQCSVTEVAPEKPTEPGVATPAATTPTATPAPATTTPGN